MLKAYTGGTFDVPHIGHVIFFEQCKYYFPDSYLVVSLNSDEFIEEFKGKKPYFTYEERYKNLTYISYIDEIILNSGGADSKIAIEKVKPDVVIIGQDWLDKDYCKQMGFNAKWLSENKISLCYIPRYADISSTLIRERMRNG